MSAGGLQRIAPSLSKVTCEQLTMSPWDDRKLLLPTSALYEWLSTGTAAVSTAGAHDHLQESLRSVRSAALQRLGLSTSGLKELNITCTGWTTLPAIDVSLALVRSAAASGVESCCAPDDWEEFDDEDIQQSAAHLMQAEVLDVLATCGLSIGRRGEMSTSSMPAFALDVSIKLLGCIRANVPEPAAWSAVNSCGIFYTLCHVAFLMFAISCSSAQHGEPDDGLKLADLAELMAMAKSWVLAQPDGEAFGVANDEYADLFAGTHQ